MEEMETARERRRRRDHERYMRHRDERRRRQREYYAANKAAILARKRTKGFERVVVRTDDEERDRATKRAQNAVYYERHREERLAYMREYHMKKALKAKAS